MKKTGIFVRASDITQPYRVWFDGNITFFAHTFEEANRKLQEAIARREKDGEKGYNRNALGLIVRGVKDD